MMSQQERAERVRAQKVVEDQQREIKHMEAELANARQQLDGQTVTHLTPCSTRPLDQLVSKETGLLCSQRERMRG